MLMGICQGIGNVANGLKIVPNPFKNNVLIEYNLQTGAQVEATIVDLTGRQIATLCNEKQDAGNHQYNFNAGAYNASAGVYFLRLVINGNSTNAKLIKAGE